MSFTASKRQYQTWRNDAFLISTDPSLIPIKALNAAFASDVFYWANPLPEQVLREALQNCVCFGLYEVDKDVGVDSSREIPTSLASEAISNVGSEAEGRTHASASQHATIQPSGPTLSFIGIARCITDLTTFVYVTDVYVDPSYQGKGLGTWLVSCVQEFIESMPYLRRSMLFAADWKRSVPFYEKIMDMKVLESKRGADGRSGEGLAVLLRLGRGDPRGGGAGS